MRLPTRDELGGIEQSSRLAFDDEVLRLAAPVVAEADTDHPSLSQIGLIVTPTLLISIRYETLKMFESVARQDDTTRRPSSAAVFAALMEAFVARLADLLEEARARLDEVSHRVFRTTADGPHRAMRSTRDARQAAAARPHRRAHLDHPREPAWASTAWSTSPGGDAKDWFARRARRPPAPGRARDIEALNQFEEHLLGKVQFLLDAVLGFINIEQNDIFKVLTIASVVGIFPTLVAGWYGMNFAQHAGVPLGLGLPVRHRRDRCLHHPAAAWFKWRGWL